MKLKKESVEIKDCKMITKSELHHEDDSLDNASATSTNQSVRGCQLNNMSAERITLISQEKVSVKQEAIEVFLDDESILQNINSKFGDYTGASTSKLNSSESQEFRICSEGNLPSYKEKVSVKQEAIEVFLDDESVPQTTYSKSEDCVITSISKSDPSKSQDLKIFSEENFPSYKEKVSFKQEANEVFFVDESLPQNYSFSKSEDCMRALKSDSNSSESQECKIYSEEKAASSKEEEVTKLEESDECMADVSNPPDSFEGLLTRKMNSNESHQHEMPSKENISAEIPSEALIIEDSKSHRENVHYSSDSSDYESDSSSSWDEFYDNLHKNVAPSQLPALKTKGELLIEDLPPVEDLDINVNATELQKIGKVLHSIISKERNEYLVVVASDGNSNPVDVDSVLFLSSDKPLGKIHDVFASVSKPNYTVRFNKAEDIYDKGVTAGQDVYYLPENDELTHYVLVDVLKQQKGSDASWKDNNEPPDDQIDYSDDEQEKLAKQKRRAKNRRNDRNWNDEEGEDVAPNKMERRNVTYNQRRTYRIRRNQCQSPASNVSSSSSSHSYSSSQTFGSTLPSSNIFSQQRNVISPQPFGLISSNNNRPAFPLSSSPQSSMPTPQTFGPFSSRNIPSSQPLGLFPHNNGPSAQTFGPLPQSRMPPPIGTFPQSSVPSYQPFAFLPTSNVLASPNFAPPHSTGVQQNPSSLMAAPQNNVPLQQQLLLQSQQPIASFLSHPPPNYNSNQNTRPFLHQVQSFAPPMFGAPPAIRPAMQNIANQSSANQIHFPLGSNYPLTSLSGSLNISPPRNITPANSNGYQGQSSGIMQSISTNPFYSSPINTQHNVYPQITSPVIVPNQSPCPTPPFVPCQTPPPSIINQQQGFHVLSSPHPPVLPSQTPPPTIPPFAFTLPAVRSPMPPQNFPYI
ncbi:H/ACA ribonucleoprotein complex non-core subunit like protein [Argiope bruennichi]|uniref:H/ACA ribonucleoprotein complex non-core subunit NAF1 n=1 Tax=Argiope bruennichi TaxID=94029 RepID=A0A8T0E630_ARGBR|nr:H/ACA ribonucleoprotein complex non-core subunit like protein [Argiope bruennichi]